MVAVLLVGRMTAQTIDTTNLDQPDVPTVILMDSDFEESSTSVNDASTLLNSSRDVFNSIAAYNFGAFQVRNNSIYEGACFKTPGSRHPYLVLRSVSEMQAAGDKYLEEYFKSKK